MSYQHFCKTVTFSLFLLFSTGLFSQTISDQLKVADCNFEIQFESEKLNIIKQIITKRGTYHTFYESGFGYESYHLEFVYSSILEIKNEGAKIIEFFDADGELLASYDFDTSLRKKSQYRKYTKYRKYYAINLCNIPLLILDDTKKIVIRED